MKPCLPALTLFLLPFSSFFLLSQTTYVHPAASGANDGTSWADAYTDLSQALDQTFSGEIWVVQGTYKPGGANPDSSKTFRIKGNVALYGGFTGNELDLSERDPYSNVTTLSGDLNGDDIPDDFSGQRSDNVQHVVVVDSLISGIVRIDGFTIKGGHTSDFNDQSEFFWRGGGVFSYSSLIVADCIFTGNFARSGGSVYVTGIADGADGSAFYTSIFEHNSSSSQSAGIFLNEISDVEVQSCTFRNNLTSRGTLYPLRCTNITISNCEFDNNATASNTAFGGAIFIWGSNEISLSNSTFTNNRAGNGGALYLNQSEVATVSAGNMSVTDCEFSNNEALDWGGGAIYVSSGSMTISNTNFHLNLASSSGGHIVFTGEDKDIVVQNCLFENGQANFGGAHTCYSGNSTFLLSNNEYRFNSAGTSGGAMTIGFTAEVTVEDCLFEENSGMWGGAIYAQNDSTSLTVRNSEFLTNTCVNNGGAINLNGGISSIIEDATFHFNQGGFGGAINVSETTDAPNEASFDLNNCSFFLNLATEQGGALNINDTDAHITNALFANNRNDGNGAGGAISLNCLDSNTVVTHILNSTFVANEAAIGAGLASWTGQLEVSSTTSLQNCIFSHDGANYEIEDGSPLLISDGGNLSTDNSMEFALTHIKDLNFTNPEFADALGFDYHLNANSPCIDAGVATGAPEYDLEGNPRVNEVDMGAYEFQFVGVRPDLLNPVDVLRVYPNPIRSVTRIELDNPWRGRLFLSLTDQQGRTVKSAFVEKNQQRLLHTLNLEQIPKGTYQLLITNGREMLVHELIKT